MNTFFDKKEIINTDFPIIEQMIDIINKVPSLNLDSLDSKETIICIVDMVKGFAIDGILSSPKINSLITPIENFVKYANSKGFTTIAFLDQHTKDSIELKFRPSHCLENTFESELVDELNNLGINKIFPKNSTNGFVNDKYLKWLKEDGAIYKNFIIVGDCTDICISQYALTQKAFFNENNIDSRIIIPINMIDTYDFEVHNANLINIFSLYQFMDNGLEVVKKIIGGDNNDEI